MQKKIFITLLVIFCSNYIFSQIKHVITIDGKMLKITAAKNTTNYSFSIQKIDTEDGKVDFTLDELEPKTFVNYFLINLNKVDSTISTSNQEAIKEANSIFYSTLANIRILNDLDKKPIVAKIEINKEVNVFSSNGNYISNDFIFEVTTTQIVFQDGFIQDIIVDGILKNKMNNDKIEVRFVNKYGIGLSGKTNIEKLQNVNLFINKSKSNNYILKKRITNYSIKVGEVIRIYDYENDNLTTDYSPANQKVTLEGGKSTILYREETYKILEAKVFSDFQGFDSQKPNGILQIEVDKKFNFWTTRSSGGFGVLEYVRINAGLNKLEDNNKFLNTYQEKKYNVKDNLSDFSNTTKELVTSKKRFSTPIDILNNRLWFVGTDLNVLLYDWAHVKSQFHININFSFNRTLVKDTLYTYKDNPQRYEEKVREYGINYFLISPKVLWHILPEKRFGVNVSYSPRYFYSLSEEVELNPWKTSIDKERTHMSKWINEFEIMGYLFINEDKKNGKLFCRWRLDSEVGYSKNNFSQFQLGYSFYILGNKN